MRPLTLHDIHTAYFRAMFRFLGGGYDIKLLNRIDELSPPGTPSMRQDRVGWAPTHAALVESLNWWHAFDDRVKGLWAHDSAEPASWPRNVMAWIETEQNVETAIASGILTARKASRGRPEEPGPKSATAAQRIAREAVADLRWAGSDRVASTVRGARYIRNVAHHDWAHITVLQGAESTVIREMACERICWAASVEAGKPDTRESSYLDHLAGKPVQRALYDLLQVGVVAVAFFEHRGEPGLHPSLPSSGGPIV